MFRILVYLVFIFLYSGVLLGYSEYDSYADYEFEKYNQRYFGADVFDRFHEFVTNFDKKSIELDELVGGGPAKDDIPALIYPEMVSTYDADGWVDDEEPVIFVYIDGHAKAYPLQILIWHEIVNDTIGEVPVVVTFCPLCYSATVYDRRVDGKVYTFGVSGFLRNSNLVMYDHQSESFWQQLTGKAIVGDLTGKKLKQVPSQIISFEQFQDEHYQKGKVLSDETGYLRNYGKNPYRGYDDIDKSPFLYEGYDDERLPPMEKLICFDINNTSYAVPYSVSFGEKIINTVVEDLPLTIFHIDGAVSALDRKSIVHSKGSGSTGVFDRRVNGYTLTFQQLSYGIFDDQTSSKWDITGKCQKGVFKGKRLKLIPHGDYFAFAWLAFKPETKIYPDFEHLKQEKGLEKVSEPEQTPDNTEY